MLCLPLLLLEEGQTLGWFTAVRHTVKDRQLLQELTAPWESDFQGIQRSSDVRERERESTCIGEREQVHQIAPVYINEYAGLHVCQRECMPDCTDGHVCVNKYVGLHIFVYA